jgi:23S rRNA pseudouridine955/2504/2580 synthase
MVLVNGLPARGDQRILGGAVIRLPPQVNSAGAKRANAFPGRSAPNSGEVLEILWEGAGLLILNKPAGLAVHGKAGEDTLEGRVRTRLAERFSPSLSFKPGPLHRLDQPSSGILVFSSTLDGARRFSALLREEKIRKRYLAILEGTLKKNETWEEFLTRDRAVGKTLPASPSLPPSAGRRALTRAFPLAAASPGGRSYTLARLEIETGRTHQIRSHAAFHGYPLAGDRKYGGGPLALDGGTGGGSFFLHAEELEIPPEEWKAAGDRGSLPPPFVRAPLPEQFRECIRRIFGDPGLSCIPARSHQAL